MKVLLLSVVLVALSFCQAPASRPAPPLSVHMADNTTRLLSSYKGKVVLLAMMQTGCPHCQHFAQQLSVYQQEYGPKGVQVLGVVFDKDAEAGLAHFKEQFVKGYPVGYSDENTVLDWLHQPAEQGYFVPIVAFISRTGLITSQHLGDDMLFQDPDHNIRRNLESLLKSGK